MLKHSKSVSFQWTCWWCNDTLLSSGPILSCAVSKLRQSLLMILSHNALVFDVVTVTDGTVTVVVACIVTFAFSLCHVKDTNPALCWWTKRLLFYHWKWSNDKLKQCRVLQTTSLLIVYSCVRWYIEKWASCCCCIFSLFWTDWFWFFHIETMAAGIFCTS